MQDELNRIHGIDGQLQFAQAEAGLTKAVINNPLASAEIHLFGGQVLQYAPVGQRPVLWVSPTAIYNGVKAIRGGVPICWPWFMSHPTDPTLPAHGFARNRVWSVAKTTAGDDGSTQLELTLISDEESRKLFPYEFALRLVIEVGKQLSVELNIQNTGSIPFPSGTAIHTYYAIDGIEAIRCSGLAGVEFVDNLDGETIKCEDEPFGFEAETERVYINSGHAVTLQGGDRSVRIEKSGSQSTVVWNPWIEKSKATGDCPDDGYQQFVCVETANVGQDVRTVEPGQTHTIRQVTIVQ